MITDQLNTQLWAAFNDVSFDEASHTYTDSKNTTYVSSTQFIKKFYPPKDWDEQAKKTAEKRGVDVEELKKEWKNKGEHATTLGTELHAVMEYLWNKKDYPGNKEKMDKFPGMYEEFLARKKVCQDIFRKMKRIYVPIANEFVVNDSINGIAGTIDFLAYDTLHNQYVIIDWKSSGTFKRENTYGENRSHVKLLAPFELYDAANVNEYSLQLSLYKYIIEKYTNIKIGEMLLFQLPKAGELPRVEKCVDMTYGYKKILK